MFKEKAYFQNFLTHRLQEVQHLAILIFTGQKGCIVRGKKAMWPQIQRILTEIKSGLS
jgi:hypothetical protein